MVPDKMLPEVTLRFFVLDTGAQNVLKTCISFATGGPDLQVSSWNGNSGYERTGSGGYQNCL